MAPLLLRTFSTMKIGGTAEKILFLKDLSHSDLQNLPNPLRILGNGSNTLIDDQPLRGTVIITRETNFVPPQILRERSGEIEVEISAGAYLPALAKWAATEGLSGCEYMVGVPGTVGGALVQNAGAHHQEFANILIAAKVLDLATMHIREFSSSDCQLGYRESFFQSHEAQFLILSVRLKLERGDSSSIQALTQTNLDYRKTKTPYSKPSLGSIFKRLSAPDKTWIFPGKLIEDCGLKGYQIGGACVSRIHANYIINEKQASFRELIDLIEFIEKTVLDKTGLSLQREIRIWHSNVTS